MEVGLFQMHGKEWNKPMSSTLQCLYPGLRTRYIDHPEIILWRLYWGWQLKCAHEWIWIEFPVDTHTSTNLTSSHGISHESTREVCLMTLRAELEERTIWMRPAEIDFCVAIDKDHTSWTVSSVWINVYLHRDLSVCFVVIVIDILHFPWWLDSTSNFLQWKERQLFLETKKVVREKFKAESHHQTPYS